MSAQGATSAPVDPQPLWAKAARCADLAMFEALVMAAAMTVPIVFRSVMGQPQVWGLPPLWVVWLAGGAVALVAAGARVWLIKFDPQNRAPVQVALSTPEGASC